MAFLLPLAVVASSVIGGALSYAGAKSTNAQSAAIAQENIAAQQQAQRDDQAFDYNMTLEGQAYQSQMAYGLTAEQERYDTLSQQRQMDYETAMSNTAYQRSVADMKAAGLNPILGVASGGASTPSVASPTVQPTAPSSPMMSLNNPVTGSTPHLINPGAALGDSISSAITNGVKAMQMVQDMKGVQAQIDQTTAATEKTKADTDFVRAQTITASNQAKASEFLPQTAQQDYNKLLQTIDNLKKTGALTDAQAGEANASAYRAMQAGDLDRLRSLSEGIAIDFERSHPGLTRGPVTSPGGVLIGAEKDVRDTVKENSAAAWRWLQGVGSSVMSTTHRALHSAQAHSQHPPRQPRTNPFNSGGAQFGPFR